MLKVELGALNEVPINVTSVVCHMTLKPPNCSFNLTVWQYNQDVIDQRLNTFKKRVKMKYYNIVLSIIILIPGLDWAQ